MKNSDGSIIMHQGGEVDVRYSLESNRSGSYCVLAVAKLLNLSTPELESGMDDFIVKYHY
jgi:protein farnesyltransferase subunit beta